MTLIAAVHISDAIYLAADSRVTRKTRKDAGTKTTWSDDFLKIEPITNHVYVACAGQLRLIGWTLEWLRDVTEPDYGIEDVRHIVKNGLMDRANRLPEQPLGRYEDVEGSFIFAGIQPKILDQVSSVIPFNVVKRLQGFQQSNSERIKNLVEILQVRPLSLIEQYELESAFSQPQFSPAVAKKISNLKSGETKELVFDHSRLASFVVDVNGLVTPQMQMYECDYCQTVYRGNGETGPAADDILSARLEAGDLRNIDDRFAHTGVIGAIATNFSKGVNGCVTVCRITPSGWAWLIAPEVSKFDDIKGEQRISGVEEIDGALYRISSDGMSYSLTWLSKSELARATADINLFAVS